MNEENKHKRETIIPEGEVGNYPESILTSFKHAITIKARVFVAGRKRRPRAIILGQNQLKMIRQDEEARWIIQGLKVEESPEKSKIQFR